MPFSPYNFKIETPPGLCLETEERRLKYGWVLKGKK